MFFLQLPCFTTGNYCCLACLKADSPCLCSEELILHPCHLDCVRHEAYPRACGTVTRHQAAQWIHVWQPRLVLVTAIALLIPLCGFCESADPPGAHCDLVRAWAASRHQRRTSMAMQQSNTLPTQLAFHSVQQHDAVPIPSSMRKLGGTAVASNRGTDASWVHRHPKGPGSDRDQAAKRAAKRRMTTTFNFAISRILGLTLDPATCCQKSIAIGTAHWIMGIRPARSGAETVIATASQMLPVDDGARYIGSMS